MIELEVRPARPADLDQVWPLARDFATSYRPVRESYEQTFARVLESPHALFLVAADGASIRGYLLAHAHDTFLANGPVAWVEELMVDAPSRGQGIGRALMNDAERWAASAGAAYVSLASRRAGLFYLALGYDESATFYKKAVTGARDVAPTM
jgi:GNAT superfamily N-acetyltransferase